MVVVGWSLGRVGAAVHRSTRTWGLRCRLHHVVRLNRWVFVLQTRVCGVGFYFVVVGISAQAAFLLISRDWWSLPLGARGIMTVVNYFDLLSRERD